MKVILNFIFLCLLIVSLTSCFSIKIDRKEAGLDPVELRQNFFFFGLINSNEVNLAEQCPRGVSAFNEKFTIGNMLATFFTLGIYSPKTVTVNCST